MNSIRTTIYSIDPGEFTGAVYTLTLKDSGGSNQNLETNYYVNIRDGGHAPYSNDATGGWDPASHHISVSADPNGTGNLSTTTNPYELEFTRGGSEGDWTGEIEVVECVSDHATDGFYLRTVLDHLWDWSDTAATPAIPGGDEWTDINQVVVHSGGFSFWTSGTNRNSKGGRFVRAYPEVSGGQQLNLSRNLTRYNTNQATCKGYSTEYVVEYGSNFTVDMLAFTDASTNGGALTATASFNTVSLSSSLASARSFVVPRMITDRSDEVGYQAHDHVVVLGDGVNTLTTESVVSIGNLHSGGNIAATLYVISHDSIAVKNIRGEIATSAGIEHGNTTGSYAVSTTVTESTTTDGNIFRIHGSRMILQRASVNGSTSNFQQSSPLNLVRAALTNSTTIEWERLRTSGAVGASSGDAAILTQLVDFSGGMIGDDDDISNTTSTVSITPSSVLANNVSSAAIIGTIKDTNGTPIEGALVEITVGGTGNTVNANDTTDALGQVTFTLTSTVPESKGIDLVAHNSGGTTVSISGGAVTFLEPPLNDRARYATNLEQITDFDSQTCYIDLVKHCRPGSVTTNPQGGNPFHDKAKEDWDSNGYQESCAITDQCRYILRSANYATYPAARYILTYDGGDWDTQPNSDITVTGGVSNLEHTTGRIEFDYDGTGNLYLQIQPSTNPMTVSNYVRNLRCVSYADVADYDPAVNLFTDDFLQTLEQFKIIRFMDWGQTNYNQMVSWSERPTESSLSSALFLYDADFPTVLRRIGAPIEHMIQLCNTLNADLWYCIPHKADDDYVTQAATLIRDNLDSNLRFIIEYSNEMWNSTFGQEGYRDDLRADYGISTSSFEPYHAAYATRACEVFELAKTVFVGQTQRLYRILAGQFGNADTATYILDSDVSTGTTLSGKAYTYADGYAFAPYWGNDLGSVANEATTEVMSVSQVLDAAETDMQAMINTSSGEIKDNVDNITPFNLDIWAYEGGQHLADLNSNATISQLFIDANRDSRMRGMYEEFMLGWDAVTGDAPFAMFTLVNPANDAGAWGLLENLSDRTEAGSGSYKWYGWQDWYEATAAVSSSFTIYASFS